MLGGQFFDSLAVKLLAKCFSTSMLDYAVALSIKQAISVKLQGSLQLVWLDVEERVFPPFSVEFVFDQEESGPQSMGFASSILAHPHSLSETQVLNGVVPRPMDGSSASSTMPQKLVHQGPRRITRNNNAGFKYQSIPHTTNRRSTASKAKKPEVLHLEEMPRMGV